MSPSRPDLSWEAAETTQARLAVLRTQIDHLDSDQRELRGKLAGVGEMLTAVAADLRVIKSLGWALVLGLPLVASVLGGIVWLIEHTRR